ncbi:MAG: response regulator transcription factor [Bacteroidales bacterium]|nr:response regulator transcription factor [Bacteroidales bacterium]MBN2757266.1 response regulator transcription factor [Bacteroidales bacterium]
MTTKINIFLVEDHKIVRDGLNALLLGINDIKIIGEASTGEDFFKNIDKIHTDIVILDIGLPDISGIEIAKKLNLEHPEIKIIILTADTDEKNIVSAVKFGVSGFLSKNTPKDEFIEAIRCVYNGEQYFGDAISKIVYEGYIKLIKANQPKDKKSLTNREIEVIKLISDGYSYNKIAEKLFISSRTVETHRNNILEKLDLKNNIELVRYAITNKIVNL